MGVMRGGRGATSRALLALCVWIGSVGSAFAADNTATGDIAGDGADLGDSNTFTLNTTTLGIVKTAFLTDGTPLASGAALPRGTLVQFMLYIDNTTSVPVVDVNVQDVLDAAFLYEAASIRVDDTTATGSTAAAIYATVSATAPLDDGVDGLDVAGIAAATLSAGASSGNVQLDIPANSVWAMLFTIEMQ